MAAITCQVRAGLHRATRFCINVEGAVLNSEPECDEEPPVTRDVNENVTGGTAVGALVSATDDDGDTLHYHLNNPTLRNTFTVDSATGQIRLGEGVTLALGQTYTVNVNAEAESGTEAMISMNIEVVKDPADPYDLNGNGAIEKEEAVQAVSDYFAGIVDKETVVALLTRYFAG